MRKISLAVSFCLLCALITVAVPASISMTSISASQPLPNTMGHLKRQVTDTSSTLTAQQPMTVTGSTVFLPAVMRDHRTCSPESPFGLQIAALHQVVPGAGGALVRKSLTEAEWLELYEEAFPTLMEALRASGACWARVQVRWQWIQPEPPPAPYVWGPYHDEKLALVAQTGVQLIGHIDVVPYWAGDVPAGPIYQDRLDEFAQFLTDLVNRYKQPPYNIQTWELFNEPDWTQTNPDNPASGWGRNGDKYAQMLAVAYPVIKAADPNATVLLGGMAYDWFTEYGGPFYRYFPDDVMAAGGDAYLDVLNLHYFPDFGPEWERWVPEGYWPTCGIVDDGLGTPYPAWGIDVIAKANHFRNRMLTCHGVDKPFWITELGEHGYDDDPDALAQQSRYVIQGYARGLAAGAEQITWFVIVSPPGDTWGQGLLFQDDWSPKPAFYTYQTLTRELGGYEYSHALAVPDVEAYVFRKSSGEETTVAWASGEPLQPAYLTFAGASQLRVVDRQGNMTLVQDGGPGDVDGMENGTISLELPGPPVDPDPNPPRLTAEPFIISK